MVWKVILIVYGILCLYIALFKPPFIWKMKKFEVMERIFKGPVGLQIFVAVWGIAALVIGIWVINA
ncbi:MAG: hypothetical protein KAU02_03690 [Tenericutes bacterium]|nr:hypothetical protein [Mycoplasmatota bacterium]